MNKYIRKFKVENGNKLRSMHHKRPKDFWKVLNSIKSRKDAQQPALDDFYEYFKNINMVDQEELDDFQIPTPDPNNSNEILNQTITAKEIETCIKTLKSLKSADLDNILNEYIKSTYKMLLPVYVQLFNIVLDTRIIPTAWVEGIFVPIYKHKGNPKDPANYRPITLLSCFRKLFTALFNTRFNNYLEDSENLNENLAGFRKSYSTLDHIFTLSCLTELFKY